MPKLTKRFVEAIIPQPEKIVQHWDAELKGFGILVLPSGRRTYFVQYRNSNRIRKHLKIGIHGQISTEEARTLAKKYLGEIAHGEDPATKKKTNRHLPLIKDLAQDYLDRYAMPRKRQRSIEEDKKLLTNIILPSIGNQQVKSISRRTIENLHNQLDKTPYQANRVLALLSKMFSLANAWEWREDNPVIGIQKYQEHKRNIWLKDQELQRLYDVLDCYHNQSVADAIRLLILTGARKSEVLNATWDQFDIEKGVWTKPDHSTKQKTMHHLPLSTHAINLLKKMAATATSTYLFPGKLPDKPLQDPKKAWDTIRKQAGIPDVRIHDIRHTHASHLVSSGLSLSIVGKLLGHTQASTTQRYAHLADEPLRHATELFGSKMDRLIGKRE